MTVRWPTGPQTEAAGELRAMTIAVTGSIATDHLMHFPGRFADQLVAEKLEHISLSFLVDDLVVRRGGVAANVAYGMGQLGLRPLLVGAVGTDFGDYRAWLESHGVDCSAVLVSDRLHTARFVCTTDDDLCQIGSFYGGAMVEAARIDLTSAIRRAGDVSLVLIGADDPAAALRHADACRELGIAFAADPSQQLARMDGEQVRTLINGAAYLLGNDYEKSLLESKTGLCDEEILDRVGVRVTTLGKRGVEITGRSIETLRVAAAPEVRISEPTGVGDAFRAGFFAGLSWGLALERSAQVGSMLATLALETVGTQEYDVEVETFSKRLGESFGAAAVEDTWPHLAAAQQV